MPLGGLVVNRRTKRRYRLDGCRRSHKKPLINLARPFLSLLNALELPDVADLRPFLSPIEEQYTAGSCVGNALASILEYFYFSATGQTKFFSRLFIYYNARMMEDDVSKRNATETDSGADIQFAIVSLMKYGCCEEKYWPFYEHLINIQPSYEAYENGENYFLDEFSRLSNNINQLRQCLAQGYPFVMAIKIFSSFASNHHGYIPMPKKHEKSSQYRHAVVCVGYIHSQRVFIIRNSHGILWGDHGYGYLPYEYITDKILTKDLWAIKSVKNMMPLLREERIARRDYPILSKSNSRQDILDDRSQCDIEYSNDEYKPEEDEDDNDDDNERVQTDFFNAHKQYHRRHSQELPREYLASSSSSTSSTTAAAQIPDNYWLQSTFVNQFPMTSVPPPTVFMNTPFARPFPYHTTMFDSAPFFRPY